MLGLRRLKLFGSISRSCGRTTVDGRVSGCKSSLRPIFNPVYRFGRVEFGRPNYFVLT